MLCLSIIQLIVHYKNANAQQEKPQNFPQIPILSFPLTYSYNALYKSAFRASSYREEEPLP